MARKVSGQMPDETGIRKLLGKFQGAAAFEIPTTDDQGKVLGNNGDALMYRVYREIVTDVGISFVEEPHKADILMLPPGGALLENYSFPSILRNRLIQYPDLPLVILPSSTLFPQTDPSFIFEGRSAPTLLVLREAFSYEQMNRNWRDSLAACNVAIELDHDVVASGHARVRSILEEAAKKTVRQPSGTLIVARLDIEARPMENVRIETSPTRKLLVSAYHRLPAWGRKRLRARVVAARQNRENDLLLERLRNSGQENIQAPTHLKEDSGDISDPTLFSFARYSQSILEAERVITNRLHVALPSAALGRETYLMDSGYHKLRGVYERSLFQNDDVHLIGSDE